MRAARDSSRTRTPVRPNTEPTTTHRDLSEVTNEEMEAVLAENPDDPAMVPMRLA